MLEPDYILVSVHCRLLRAADGSGAKIRHWVNLSDVYDLKQINTKLKTMSIREFVQTTKKVDITIASMQKKWARKVSAGDVMKRWGISSKNLDVGTKTSWAHVKEVTSKAKYVAMRFDHFGSPARRHRSLLFQSQLLCPSALYPTYDMAST